MITLSDIQKRLAEAIKQSGMSQTAIAKALNLSPSSIAQYVRGAKLRALHTLANLCKVLDADANYILCLED